MNLSLEWIDDPMIWRLTMTLMHFVWQGALIGVAAMIAMLGLRRAAPQVRYLVLVSLMMLMVAVPIMTFVTEPNATVPGDRQPLTLRVADGGSHFLVQETDDVVGETTIDQRIITSTAEMVETNPSDAPVNAESSADMLAFGSSFFSFDAIRASANSQLSAIALLWLAGVVILSARLLLGLGGAEWLRWRDVQPASNSCQSVVVRLSERLGLWQTVRLVESTYVKVPTVVGWIKPVILIPPSAVLGMTPQQLEAILAHELAHVARHDYLVNVWQNVVETLLFYHPAVWWISNRIRRERENCCDDIAVDICGDRRVYAQRSPVRHRRTWLWRPTVRRSSNGYAA